MSPRPDSPLSRRRVLLAGGSVLGLGSASFVTNTMPAPVVDARTKHVGIPSIPPRIEIPASHVRVAKAHAQRIIDEAKTEWKRADKSALKEFDRDYLNDLPDRSRATIDDIQDGSGTPQTLERCQWAASTAAKTLGTAQYLNDEYTEKNPKRSQTKLEREIDSFRTNIEYECDDPNDFLVHVGRVERHTQQAASFLDLDSPPEDAMEAGKSLRDIESARRDFDDGRRLYERYRGGLKDPNPFGDTLARNRTHLEQQAEELRSKGDDNADDDLPKSPYRRLRGRIYTHGWFYGRSTLWDATRYREGGYEVLSATTTADALQHFLAWRDAKRRVDIPEESGEIGSKRVFRAKKLAVSELRTALSKTDDGSFARILLDTAHGLIDSGDSTVDDEDFPHAEAYGRYLLGWAYSKHAANTAERLIRR
ncbi:hypothetical protein [Haladaptatus sp. T7]|uniref:hypothetical protein n=1 Tax=Haladaptatus sp. T7 TaxID=2029368 RepID=UPI0022314493|nr:hypothetical protein [Haladaptatus sp. T7]